ncbi:MAG: hypothetical protein EOO38_31805, partial [Cytophagaceae bacterium]
MLKWCYKKDSSDVGNGDYVRVDQIRLSPPDLRPPASLTAVGSNDKVNLSVAPTIGSQTGYLFVYGTSPTTFVPVNGTTPYGTKGNDSVIDAGASLNIGISPTPNGILHYFAVYSYDANRNYSTASTATATPWGVYTPTTFTSVTGNAQLTLNWDSPAGGSQTGFLLVRNTGSAVSFAPSNGTGYSVGAVTGGTIVYKGSALTYPNTGLTNGTMYYYSIWSYDGSNRYSQVSRSLSATPALCGGVTFDNSCWYAGVAGSTCNATCTANSMTYDAAALARNYSSGSPNTCRTLIQTLGFSASNNGVGNSVGALLCSYDTAGAYFAMSGSGNTGAQA